MSTERITIVGVEVSNYRRLTVAEIKLLPERGLVRVTGPNAAGKTSLLKAVAGVLGGAGEVHEGSLHEGAENGRVRLQLSNGFTVERRVTESAPKGYLTVVGPDEGKHTQGKLNSWLGDRSFDPLAFLGLGPDRQREVLFSIGTDPELPAKLEAVRQEYRETYEERTPVISRKRHLAKIEQPEGERPEPVDTSAEMARLRELQAQERKRGDAFRAWRDAERGAERQSDVVAGARKRVRELEAALTRARERLVTEELHEEEKRKAVAAAEEAFGALDDPSAEIAVVQDRIEQAEAVSESLAPWRLYDAAQAELEDLDAQEEQLTTQLRALKAREADLLEKAGIPVEGLSFDENGAPLLDGRDLALASGAQQIDLAVDVAIAANPELGVCLLDEANDLDLVSLKRLHDRAVEHGFQIWACRLGLEGDGEIVVADGVAKSSPEAVAL